VISRNVLYAKDLLIQNRRMETSVCEQCVRLDETIARHRNMARSLSDKRALDAIDSIIRECEEQKRVLHPESD
jgi:hypothetical protein